MTYAGGKKKKDGIAAIRFQWFRFYRSLRPAAIGLAVTVETNEGPLGQIYLGSPRGSVNRAIAHELHEQWRLSRTAELKYEVGEGGGQSEGGEEKDKGIKSLSATHTQTYSATRQKIIVLKHD